MNRENNVSGWYYREDGNKVGPVSPPELRELLVSGRISHQQAVWKKEGESLLFITAATAIKEN